MTPEVGKKEDDHTSNNEKLNSAIQHLANQAASTINEESSSYNYDPGSSILVHQNNLLKE